MPLEYVTVVFKTILKTQCTCMSLLSFAKLKKNP